MLDYGSLILGISNSVYIFSTYVDGRQLGAVKKSKRPTKALQSSCTQEEFEKAKAYEVEKSTFGLIQSAFNQIEANISLFWGFLPLFWTTAGAVLGKAGFQKTEIMQSLVFLALTTLYSTVISIPFSAYSTFIIEKKHGFNKTTVATFITDAIKSLAVTAIIGGPVMAALIWIIKWSGNYFVPAVWCLLAVVQVVMILIYPTVIQPLFNKFEALPEGSLRSKIEALATRLSFPLTHIYVMDGSKRTSHSNAYFFGLFKDKRIVLFDTLIDQMKEEEICGILGHELGHWKLSHMARRLVGVQVQLLVMFYLFGKFMHESSFYTAFGFTNEKPLIIGLTLFSHLYSPISILINALLTYQSRRHEFEADRFAHDLGYNEQLKSGLVKLYNKNKHLTAPDWLYSTLHYSHPPANERLSALERLKAKSN